MKRIAICLLVGAVLLGAAGCDNAGVTLPGIAQTTVQTPTDTTHLLPTEPADPTVLPTWPTTQPTEPTMQPTEPTMQPTEPTMQPTEPTTQPTEPTMQPTEPTTQPTEPTTQPTEPTTQPTEPTTQPTEPTTQPTEPTTQPVEYPLPQLDPGKNWIISGCNSHVSLRRSPSVEAASNGILYKGTQVEFLGWYGKFAKVRYKNLTGYVLSGYIKPTDDDYLQTALDTVRLTNMYTYDEMMEDLIAFEQAYPERVMLEIIGESEWGTDIPVMRIGNENAKRHVLLHGSIHGREHFTTWILMAMADYWLDRDLASYGDVCYHIIPMVNPDGVSISQSGVLPEELMEVYRADLQNGYTTASVTEYARKWKANGLGVDLNRNFPAGWETIDDRTGPSSERYRGESPFSETETQMLREYTNRYDFAVTLSYHCTGSVVYYGYGNNKTVNKKTEALAYEIYKLNGYSMMPSTGVDAAGYKDWAIDSLKIPSVTVEIGGGTSPVNEREMYSIFVRNCDMLPLIAKWVK